MDIVASCQELPQDIENIFSLMVISIALIEACIICAFTVRVSADLSELLASQSKDNPPDDPCDDPGDDDHGGHPFILPSGW